MNTIIRSGIVLACILGCAFLVFVTLSFVNADDGAVDTGPSRAELLDEVFSAPGIAPKEQARFETQHQPALAASDPHRNPVGVIGGEQASDARYLVSTSSKPAPASAVRRWWPAEAGPSGFGIRHVGTLHGERAIAIFFHGAVRGEALAKHVTVRDARGKTISPRWQVPDGNSRLATMPVDEPGRYTLIIQGQLADVRGRALGANMHGPVFIN